MSLPIHIYMQRCLELADHGSGYAAPNPMVGAVLVCNDQIIGEGFHKAFGQPHAEVNAIEDAIQKGKTGLLSESTLFVNLEPCSHTGKTPPCTDLILKYRIPHLVIGMTDPFPEVNGRGIEKLRSAGIKVEVGVLETEARELNKRFITYFEKRRPFVLLKFAQTADRFIAPSAGRNRKISNETTDILVHRWRSQEGAILVGKHTVETDNPLLTTRHWPGKNPLRITIDRQLRLPLSLNIFNADSPTLVFNELKNEIKGNTEFMQIDFQKNILTQILEALYRKKINSVMVEGGSNLIGQFVEQGIWDEAIIITSDKKFGSGIPAPEISGTVFWTIDSTGDTITSLRPNS